MVQGPGAAVTAVRAGNVFDGDRAIGPATVIVQEGSIVAIQTRHPDPPADAVVIEFGPDVWLLPGLIDAHMHLGWDAGADPVARLMSASDHALLEVTRCAARKALDAGITTVRDLGDRLYSSLRFASGLEANAWTGPRIVAAGPPLTVPGGHCYFLGGETCGEAGLRKAVRERFEHGCQVVKVMASGGHLTPGSPPPWQSQFSAQELAAVVDEAHGLGLSTAAHAHGAGAIADAVSAGFDTVEHCTFMTEGGISTDPLLLDRMAERGMTASLTYGRSPGAPALPAALAAKVPAVMKAHEEMYRAGVRIVVGTDAGIALGKDHDVLPYGLAELTGIGMTSKEVLRSATLHAARACGVGHRTGRLAAGMDADLLAVRGDPTRDLSALRDVVAVFRAGHRVR